MQNQTTIIICPNCNSKSIIKRGKRKRKFREVQQFQCRECKKFFSPEKQDNKTYHLKIILSSISTYNLGYNLNQVSNLIKSRYKLNIPISTLSSWINEYKEICTYNKLRKEALKLYSPKNIIFKTPLHHQQIYNFQYHKAKLHLLFHNIKYNNMFTNQSRLYAIKDYLENIPTKDFPHHIFKSYETKIKEGIIKSDLVTNKNIIEQRASQLKLSTLPIVKKEKQNQANKLTKLALETASSKSKAHTAIEKFFLVNDSTTIAVEVPVYLTNDDIKYFKDRKFEINLENYATPITGHIDILQIRNGLIHILDYKPEADKQNPIEQLVIYALALASRTKLALRDFKCAWFDENSYFEFFPLHVVYKKKSK